MELLITPDVEIRFSIRRLTSGIESFFLLRYGFRKWQISLQLIQTKLRKLPVPSAEQCLFRAVVQEDGQKISGSVPVFNRPDHDGTDILRADVSGKSQPADAEELAKPRAGDAQLLFPEKAVQYNRIHADSHEQHEKRHRYHPVER